MPVIYINKLTREDAEDNPEALFLYTDNEDQKGGSTLAKELRGEENAVGVRVKRSPTNYKSSFFSEEDVPEAINYIDEDLELVEAHLNDGGVVIIPATRFENDTALEENSPEVYQYFQDKLKELGKL